jgi:hypothetical protein
MMGDLIPIAVIGAAMALVGGALCYVCDEGKEPDIFSYRISRGDEFLGHVIASDMFDAIELASERFGHETFDKLERLSPCRDESEVLMNLLRTREAELARARAEASSAKALIVHLLLAIEEIRREPYD